MNNHHPILELDPATRTGWAVGGHGSVVSGAVDFGQHRGNRPALFEGFDLWLSDMVTEHDPAMLVFATPIQRGPGSRTGFGLATIIELTAARHTGAGTRNSPGGRCGEGRVPFRASWGLSQGEGEGPEHGPRLPRQPVTLAVERWYDFQGFGCHLGNVG